jgi:hypothetical protein
VLSKVVLAAFLALVVVSFSPPVRCVLAAGATGAGLPPTYWLAGRDGSVYALGSAGVFGSLRGVNLAAPVVGMAATPSGHGYWLVASDGGVFSFGDARFYGSTGSVRLNRPVVGIAPTPGGGGYWLVASDGGVFTFGDARFYGSTGNVRLNQSVVGIAPTPSGRGYWLVASDGGVFTFGDALFRGSVAGQTLPAPVVAITPTSSLDPYMPGTTGYDISWPQCGSSYPALPFRLAVVGVGGKVTFTHNPCLASEAAWFASATLTLYVKLSSPALGTPGHDATGPAGNCAATDTSCRSYNYGWNLAQDAYRYARSQGVSSPLWWLDVEGPPGSVNPLWTSNTSANSRVVSAAIAALTGLGVQAGVYSNSYQWPLIVGPYGPNVPMWQARPNPAQSANQAAVYCQTATFTPGPVWLVQYGNNPYDRDLAC